MTPQLPRLTCQNRLPLPLGFGVHGTVYAISSEEDLVAKVSSAKDRDLALGDLQHEYDIASRLYWAGVSVPRPKGVYDVRLLGMFHRPAFVMERIHAQRVSTIFASGIDYQQRRPIREKIDYELEKARSIGFVPDDATVYNCFYIPDQERVVLFDFAKWKKK